MCSCQDTLSFTPQAGGKLIDTHVTMQVTLDTVEVVLALKDDGSGQREHGEGLKETVQQAAAGVLLPCVQADTCACFLAMAMLALTWSHAIVAYCRAVTVTVEDHDVGKEGTREMHRILHC